MAERGRSLRNSIEIQVKEESVKDVTLKTIMEDLLEQLLGLQVSDTYAVQDFVEKGLYIVSFFIEAKCVAVYETLVKKKIEGSPLLDMMDFRLMFEVGVKFVTVHVHNPFMETHLVRTYLRRYCTEVGIGERLNNAWGAYRAKIKFKVRLRPDADGVGVVHLPAAFNVAGERCTVVYSGQPRFCRYCFEYGHERASCQSKFCCRICKQRGHMAAQCSVPRTCDLCGESGHLVRECRKTWGRKLFSYAEVVRGREWMAGAQGDDMVVGVRTEEGREQSAEVGGERPTGEGVEPGGPLAMDGEEAAGPELPGVEEEGMEVGGAAEREISQQDPGRVEGEAAGSAVEDADREESVAVVSLPAQTGPAGGRELAGSSGALGVGVALKEGLGAEPVLSLSEVLGSDVFEEGRGSVVTSSPTGVMPAAAPEIAGRSGASDGSSAEPKPPVSVPESDVGERREEAVGGSTEVAGRRKKLMRKGVPVAERRSERIAGRDGAPGGGRVRRRGEKTEEGSGGGRDQEEIGAETCSTPTERAGRNRDSVGDEWRGSGTAEGKQGSAKEEDWATQMEREELVKESPGSRRARDEFIAEVCRETRIEKSGVSEELAGGKVEQEEMEVQASGVSDRSLTPAQRERSDSGGEGGSQKSIWGVL